MTHVTNEEALAYHEGGKIEIKVKTPCATARDLSMAYTPGVAVPCKEIEADNELAYKYTNKANLVAVITDGTAVLGLGDIGAVAGKPVMEGKAVLFKKFANVDAFDIELDEHDPDKIVEICKALAPTFGGINLEDIRAPKCFEIERKLQEAVDIPVMHDDQHGTAIITTAALINALKISGKKAENLKLVVSGSGAAGIACAKMYKKLGVKNIVMLDSKGVIHSGRTDLTDEKKEFAITTNDRTIADAMRDADMFLGLSKGGLLSGEMVATMAKDPIIFALANPTPEIFPEEVAKVRDDVIMGTGRSDYPNQVNNVLGFPFIFRGALDVRATK
uniref:malic enzyme-like NAD(P)-binding protein n=1 Tax=Campylobacter showae TaxID=204 RepID=UPI003C70313B